MFFKNTVKMSNFSITLHYKNKFVICQIQKCPTAKYIVHLKCTVNLNKYVFKRFLKVEVSGML